MWTLELIFFVRKESPGFNEPALSGCTQKAQIVLNKENMIPEDSTIGSFVSKGFLKKVFFNEEFNLMLSDVTD